MQIKHIALATLLAFSLAACGSSNDEPNPNPTPNPDQPTPGADVIDLTGFEGDPFKNETVADFDVKTTSSVGSISYVRGEKSNFAKKLNPDADKHQFAATLFSIKLEPALNNMVLARSKVDDTTYSIVVGDLANRNSKDFGLMEKNVNNVKDINEMANLDASYDFGVKVSDNTIKADGFKELLGVISGELKGTSDPNPEEAEFKKVITKIKSVTVTNNDTIWELKSGLGEVEEALADAKNVVDQEANSETKETLQGQYKAALVQLENLKAEIAEFRKKIDAAAAKVGKDAGGNADKDKIHGVFFTAFDKEDVVPFDTVYANNAVAADYGLVVKKDEPKQTGVFIGRDETRNGSTRIFGHQYGHDLDNATKANSWSRAVLYAEEDLVKDGNVNLEKAQLGVVPMRLNYVQYGRVTANLDVDIAKKIRDKDFEAMPGNDKWKFITADYATRKPMGGTGANKNDVDYAKSKGVDSYFYRGVDATSVAQMDALKETTIKYAGHAVAFGVDHNFRKETAADQIPNSVALGTMNAQAVGDFVEAKLDLGKKELQGTIYNTWRFENKDGAGNITQIHVNDNALIKFRGKVIGNSVGGSAELAYDSDSKGSFRASFFGPNAEELGGVVNSTTTKETYKAAKWGAVFGAQRIVDDAIKTPGFDANIEILPQHEQAIK